MNTKMINKDEVKYKNKKDSRIFKKLATCEIIKKLFIIHIKFDKKRSK